MKVIGFAPKYESLVIKCHTNLWVTYLLALCLTGRYNQLMSLPKTLGNCTQMDEFNVEGNNITQLPVSTNSHFSVVTRLRVLNT